MAKIGYARCSTLDQDYATQEARLKAAGCDIIRAEKVSGASRDGRDELATIVDFIRAGDGGSWGLAGRWQREDQGDQKGGSERR